LSVAACLAPEPPEYRAPERTPPVFNLHGADPPVFQRLELQLGSQKPFTIPFRSEDAGESLWALLKLNYTLGAENEEQNLAARLLPPSTFDDLRDATLTWRVDRVPVGCHHLSFLVAHQSSVDDSSSEYPITDPDDVAVATWVTVITDPSDPDPVAPALDDCPEKLP
jgi:hypothetical protein